MNKEIYFIGLGGAGCHILDRLAGMGFDMGRSIAIDSDKQVLSTLKYCTNTLMVSDKFSTAGDIELGMSFFEKKKESILSELSNAKAVFAIVGLGGGTGSAGILSIANWLNQLQIPLISLVILPFGVEGELKNSKAKSILLEVKAKSYISIIFDNNDITKENGNIPMQKALLASDIRQMKNLLFEIALLKGYDEETAINSLNLTRSDYEAWSKNRNKHDSTFSLHIDNKSLNWFTPYEIEMIIKDFARKYPEKTATELVSLIHQDAKYSKIFIYPSDVTKVLNSNKNLFNYKDIYLDMFNRLKSATLELSDKLDTKLFDWVESKVVLEGKAKSVGIAYLIDMETNSIYLRVATKTQVNKPAILSEFGAYLKPADKIIIPDYKYFANLHNSGNERITKAGPSQLALLMQVKKYVKSLVQQNEYRDKKDLSDFLLSYVHNYNNVTKYDTILNIKVL